MLPTPLPASAPVVPSTMTKPVTHTAPVVRPWNPPQADSKSCIRDPRLNRTGPPTSQPKEQTSGKKDSLSTTGSALLRPEKRTVEKPAGADKCRVPKKEASEEKKSKSLSPSAKGVQGKNKTEAENQKSDKKDPRLRKRTQDKAGDGKDNEQKEAKRCNKEKEDASQGAEPPRLSKGKPVNGVVAKHDHNEPAEKAEFKTGGNARTHARKRIRSRSRSRSPPFSPKRKDRRSPKGQTRSSSLSPSPSHKSGKARRLRVDEAAHKPGREERITPKNNQSEGRRSKRPSEDWHAESKDSHSPRGHDGAKEGKETSHRRRSSWDENKQ